MQIQTQGVLDPNFSSLLHESMDDGGTIFLVEAGEVRPLIQVNLLRVLQEREIEQVGKSKK